MGSYKRGEVDWLQFVKVALAEEKTNGISGDEATQRVPDDTQFAYFLAIAG
jgi:hypothetical protein